MEQYWLVRVQGVDIFPVAGSFVGINTLAQKEALAAV
jgi:hypothetical protein